MFPLTDNSRHKAALDDIAAVYARHDLTGGFVIIDAQEASYRYILESTWNAFVDDPETPLGWRIRAKSAELGQERAKGFIEGAVWTMGGLRDFARMTDIWMRDLMRMLRQAGIRIHYNPFGGKRLPRLTSQKPP